MTDDLQLLAVADIRTDGGTQPRAGLNEDTVRDYTDAMKEGAEFPAVEVYREIDSDSGATWYWLADGFHRLAATKRLEHTAIEARVREGGQRQAVLHSVGANATHGLPRTNADKRRAAFTLLTDDEWSQWSDREIARRCGVSNRFVGNLRRELAPVNGSQSELRKGADGRVIDVSNIGAPAPPLVPWAVKRWHEIHAAVADTEESRQYGHTPTRTYTPGEHVRLMPMERLGWGGEAVVGRVTAVQDDQVHVVLLEADDDDVADNPGTLVFDRATGRQPGTGEEDQAALRLLGPLPDTARVLEGGLDWPARYDGECEPAKRPSFYESLSAEPSVEPDGSRAAKVFVGQGRDFAVELVLSPEWTGRRITHEQFQHLRRLGLIGRLDVCGVMVHRGHTKKDRTEYVATGVVRRIRNRIPYGVRYLTNELAEELVELLPIGRDDNVLEPHVGGGALARAIARRLFYGTLAMHDINPDAPGLELEPECPHERRVRDFVTSWDLSWLPDWVIASSPSLDEAEAHVRQALRVSQRHVVFLLPLTFITTADPSLWREFPTRKVWALTTPPVFLHDPDRRPYGWFWWDLHVDGPGVWETYTPGPQDEDLRRPALPDVEDLEEEEDVGLFDDVQPGGEEWEADGDDLDAPQSLVVLEAS